MIYEWDEAKQVSNLKKHGIAFEDVLSVFSDKFSLSLLDDRFDYGECRYNIIGAIHGVIICVTFTHRTPNVRIISARVASRKERASYEQQKID